MPTSSSPTASPTSPAVDVRPARAAAPRARWPLAPAILGWAVGMGLAFRDTVTSRFALVQGEPVDARLVTYLLEHSYRWLTGAAGHASLWSPPIFYPAPNTFAYSESLLSVAPVYWAFRALGLPPDTALQWWMLAAATLDYVAMYVLLRRAVRVGRAPAALGALLFAFGSVRVAQIRHQHLIPHFYTIVALLALVHLFEEGDPGRGPRALRWPALFAAGVVGQLYAAVYYGWFLALALALAGLWALAVPRWRRALVATLRRRWLVLTVAAMGGLVATAPLAVHYLAAAHAAGYWDYAMVSTMRPRVQSWLYLGPQSWMYHRLAALDVMRAIPMEHEQRLGLGVVTTVCVVAGFWVQRRRALVALLALTALTLIVLVTQWPGGRSAWALVYDYVPSARAIRAVSRVGLVLLIPAAVGLALFAERLRARPVLGAAVTLLVIVEQGQTLLAYDKGAVRERAALVAQHVPPGCRAFLFTALHGREDPWVYHVDAMWASMTLAIPTVNGYSGRSPPEWPFYAAVVRDSASDAQLTRSLAAWLARWQLPPSAACRVTLDIDALTRRSP